MSISNLTCMHVLLVSNRTLPWNLPSPPLQLNGWSINLDNYYTEGISTNSNWYYSSVEWMIPMPCPQSYNISVPSWSEGQNLGAWQSACLHVQPQGFFSSLYLPISPNLCPLGLLNFTLTMFLLSLLWWECALVETMEASLGSSEISQREGSTFQRKAQIKRLCSPKLDGWDGKFHFLYLPQLRPIPLQGVQVNILVPPHSLVSMQK